MTSCSNHLGSNPPSWVLLMSLSLGISTISAELYSAICGLYIISSLRIFPPFGFTCTLSTTTDLKLYPSAPVSSPCRSPSQGAKSSGHSSQVLSPVASIVLSVVSDLQLVSEGRGDDNNPYQGIQSPLLRDILALPCSGPVLQRNFLLYVGHICGLQSCSSSIPEKPIWILATSS